ncbi:MAG: lipopolysaccharide biosynthesis protein [Solirubrobacterales bacterium]
MDGPRLERGATADLRPLEGSPKSVTADQPKSSSLRGGIAWSLLTFVGTKALTFLATLVLARLLVPSEFGVLAAVLAFVTLLEQVSDLGMKATVIYHSERGVTGRVQTAFTVNLIFTAAMTVVAVALAPLIAQFFGVESHTILFRIAALDLLLTGLGNIHDAMLLRDMQFRLRMVPQLTGNVFRGASTILMAVAGLGATALVIGYVAGTAVWAVTLWIVKPFAPTFQIIRSAAGGVITYGGWATVLALLAVTFQRVDTAVVGSTLGAAALGLFTVAQRIPELIVGNVTWSLSVVAFPALAHRRDRGDDSLTETTLSLIRYTALFGMPLSAGMAVLATPLVVVLFSGKWLEAGAVMQPMAILFGLVCVVFPLGDTFKALGKQRVMAGVYALSLPILIGVMIVTAPAGIVAVAWALVGVTAVQSIVWIVLITNVLDLRLRAVAAMLRPALAAAGGVALGAATVRILLPAYTIGPLLAGTVAACLLGAISLRVFARSQYDELQDLLRQGLGSVSFVPPRFSPTPPAPPVEVVPIEVEEAVEVAAERQGGA